MCVIAIKTADQKFDYDDVLAMFSWNDDGAGFAAAHGYKLDIQRGFFSPKSLWKALQKVQHLPVMLHCRIATSGKDKKGNCHPFRVSRDVAFAHNGVARHFEGFRDPRSDSKRVAEDILSPIIERIGYDKFVNDGGAQMLQTLSGTDNRFVVFNKDGRYVLTNADDWSTDPITGIIFSNQQWMWAGKFEYTPQTQNPYSHEPTIINVAANKHYTESVLLCNDCRYEREDNGAVTDVQEFLFNTRVITGRKDQCDWCQFKGAK